METRHGTYTWNAQTCGGREVTCGLEGLDAQQVQSSQVQGLHISHMGLLNTYLEYSLVTRDYSLVTRDNSPVTVDYTLVTWDSSLVTRGFLPLTTPSHQGLLLTALVTRHFFYSPGTTLSYPSHQGLLLFTRDYCWSPGTIPI